MNLSYKQVIALGAVVSLIGFILSGPVAFAIIHVIRPQPAWVSPSVFIDNYSPIQNLPFYFGFLLIGGMLMLAAGHYLDFRERNTLTKFHLLLALAWTNIFAGLISFNYICQTTFIHNLARNYKPEYDGAIASFSMSNPLSFCWANEMWGYAILGVATWLTAGYYRRKSNLIRGLLIANGIISIVSAGWTILDVNWLMTTSGIVGYIIWNILMIVLVVAIYYQAKRGLKQSKIAHHENTFHN